MKRFIRCTCMLLAMVMVLAIPAFAVEAIEPKASSFFGRSSVYLCNVSGNYFEAWFDVTATGTMDAIGASVIKIQQSSDGVNWTTVKTCLKENYLYLVDYNSTTHTAGVSYTGTAGYYYRAYIELYAKKGVNTGTMSEYTSSIYIPAS